MTVHRGVGLLLLLAATAAPARAQFESQMLSKIQLNLVNPGGKSLAMGGAFVALADDATAALANPAGITQIRKFQAGISGKSFQFTPELGTSDIDFRNGQEVIRAQGTLPFSEETGGLEFASFVAPVTPNLSIALYYAVNLRYRLDTTDRPAGNYRSINVQEDGYRTTIDEQGAVDVRNELVGLSAGYALGRVAVGAGITLSSLRFAFDGAAGGARYAIKVNNYAGSDDPFSREVESEVSSGTRAGGVVGLKWEAYEPLRLAFGASFRRSPRFDVLYTVRTVRTGEPSVSYRCNDGSTYGQSACGSFKVPDDLSLGASFWPLQQLAVSGEMQRVFYSQLNDGFVPAFSWIGLDSAGNEVEAVARGESDDVWVPRIGAEYTWIAKPDLHLHFRAGYYFTPAHATRILLYPDANGDRLPDSATPVDAQPYSRALQIAFEGGESEHRFSAGLGASIGRRISIDLAYEQGRFAKNFVASAFLRF